MQIDPPCIHPYKALRDLQPASAQILRIPTPSLFPVSLLGFDLQSSPRRSSLLPERSFRKMNAMRSCFVPVIVGFMFLTLLQLSYGQSVAPSPAPEGPSNDGKAIDQGIAYVLLFAALAITYLFH
ncbi:hypothetical protein BT93_C0621 [Corymbia citriodora subsp. variegata]|nr:hypothetical protein BT93_C0621 [Corymbia citriodora subsp. variegata]